jgi:Tol biopolymer transport system component
VPFEFRRRLHRAYVCCNAGMSCGAGVRVKGPLLAAGLVLLVLGSLSGAANGFPGRNGRLLLSTCDESATSQDRVPFFRSILPSGRDFRTIAEFKEGLYCYVYQATWSPDGRMILYDSGYTVWTLRVDDKKRRQVVPEGQFPAWSPTGREIVYVKGDGSGAMALFRARLDGSRSRQITPWMETELVSPAWSPNGRTIAFYRWFEGKESVWSVRANGGTPRQLAEEGWRPSWSLDSRRILFSDRRSVWIMSAGGGRKRRLTSPVTGDEYIGTAVFSPDGRKIAFVRTFRAWVMNANGKKPHPVSPLDALVLNVDWRSVRG